MASDPNKEKAEKEREEKEYREYVAQSVEDGTYFRDAYSWYSVSYLMPLVDRSFFAILSVIGVFIVINLVLIISLVLPLVEVAPIVLKERDSTQYFPVVRSMAKDKKITKGTDEAILRYITESYLIDREQHNYIKGDLQEYNNKFNRIKNNSSVEEFENFKRFMSKSNQNSPIHFFGKDAETIVDITSFAFERIKREKFIDNVTGFFQKDPLPLKAVIYYNLTTRIGGDKKTEKRMAVISFKFSISDSLTHPNITFTVTDYKNYRV